MSKSKFFIIFFAACFALVAYAGTELVSITPDPVTGRMIKAIYTKYYDAGVWMIPDRVGLSVVVDQVSQERGKFTVYVWNRDRTPHNVKLTGLSLFDRPVELKKSELVAIPDERSGLEIGDADVSNYEKILPVELSFEIDGNAGKVTMQLNRRTRQDMKKFFGKRGKPPYPWYQD